MPGVSSSKAKKILSDKSIRGKALTSKQRRFFGARSNPSNINIVKKAVGQATRI